MSDQIPTPPEGFATWLDHVLDPVQSVTSESLEYAKAELAKLRRVVAQADEVVQLCDEHARILAKAESTMQELDKVIYAYRNARGELKAAQPQKGEYVKS